MVHVEYPEKVAGTTRLRLFAGCSLGRIVGYRPMPSVEEKSGTGIFITGYARLPQGITAAELYHVLGIGVEVDPATGVITDADCTLATAVGRNFFRKLVVGYNLEHGIEPLVKEFECRYHGSAKKTIIAALKVVNQRYLAYKSGMMEIPEE
ncbi:MAG: DUF3870 domain-containing protein [Bacillota bacterium]